MPKPDVATLEEAAAFIAWYDKAVPAIKYDSEAIAIINRLRSDLEAASAKLARVEAEIQNFIDVTPRERTPFDFLQRLRGVLTDYADLKRECGL